MSNLADGIFKLALPLVALRFTRSPGLVAGVEVVRSLPWLLLALQAGAVVDRSDRRRTMLLANVVRAVAVGVPALVLLTGNGALWLLYLVALATGVAEVFYDTASQSILPSLVPRERLSRANGRLYAVEYGMQQLVGPPLAGLLVGAGVAMAFGLPALLWLTAVAALLVLHGSFRPERRGAPTTIRVDIAEGLAFLRGHRLLRTLAGMVGVTNLASSATGALLVLFVVGEESALGLTEAGAGVLLLALAVGGMVGTVVVEHVERALGRARTIRLSIVLFAQFAVAPALTTDVALVAASLFAGGVGMMLWNIPTVSFRQNVTPDRLLGRVNSAYRLLAWGALPLGAALGGLLGELLGIRPVFAVMGAVTLLLLLPAGTITDVALDAAEADADLTEER